MNEPLPWIGHTEDVDLWTFDLFAADPQAHTVPPSARYAAYDLAHDRVYVPVAFVGTSKLIAVIRRLAPPASLVPIAENDRGLFVALDWLEEHLSAEHLTWQAIRQLLRDHPPPAANQ